MEHPQELVTSHIKSIATLEENVNTIFKKIDDLKIKISKLEVEQTIMHEMNTNIKLIAQNQEYQGKEIYQIKAQLTVDNAKAGKRWELVVSTIITAITAGAVGYLLSLVF